MSTLSSATIMCNVSVNGIRFGVSELHITNQLVVSAGVSCERRVSHTGEVELLIGGAIYRVLDGRFVEATFPDHGAGRFLANINAVSVVSVFDWLGQQSDQVDLARFRISERLGIAYDYRNPDTGSYTVFAPGHWSGVLAGQGF